MDGSPNLRLCNLILDVQITPFGPKSLYALKGGSFKPTNLDSKDLKPIETRWNETIYINMQRAFMGIMALVDLASQEPGWLKTPTFTEGWFHPTYKKKYIKKIPRCHFSTV